MTQEREKMIEFAVLTFVGLVAFIAILVFLPDASAQSIPQLVQPGPSTAVVMTASTPSTERSIRAE